ncbi:MAG: hypothetical protein DME01_26530 [Candidatus Rokuibacteriota bacterium]|nr:MAG: hypothetical protein DME01_26530 [Candidatus Rokubacteria bacterium]
MVKALSFFKRRAGMPVDEFQAYWRTRHPDVVTKLPGVHRYVQSHTRPAAYRDGEPAYDGIAEVWFEDTAAMHALRGTPEVAAVQADEARFIDRSTMEMIITDDHVIKDGPAPSGAAKGVGFARRKPGMTVEAFQRHWREVHGPLGAALPTLRRYVQSHPRRSAYSRGRDPAWDGIAIIWFDDAEALRAATTTPEWDRVKADEENFVAPGPVAFIVTTEHVIVA